MSKDDIREPEPWVPGQPGAFIVELSADRAPLALHTFLRYRGHDPSEGWYIVTVCELRGIDLGSPSGEISADGSFSFNQRGANISKAVLVTFITATDPRLHLDDGHPWAFTFE